MSQPDCAREPAPASEKLRIATWNTEWRATNSADAATIRDRLRSIAPDIVCLTETHTDFLASWGGHAVVGSDDWGGPTFGTRREVLLWSKAEWVAVDRVGSPALPPGRFVKATTSTLAGPVTVVGVVVPYHMAHVRTGTRNRRLWELHRAYLESLPEVTSSLGEAAIVLGDFNQRVPSNWVPRELRQLLTLALSGLNLATEGEFTPTGARAIDHIAAGRAFSVVHRGILSNMANGKEISDHFGVWVDLERRVAIQST